MQATWNATYGARADVWYPPSRQGRAPGHHGLLRPLLAAFTQGHDIDLAAARLASGWRPPRDGGIEAVIERAHAEGVGTLLLSSEDLDRVRPEDAETIRSVFGALDVTVVLTATRPVHRWCSGWQTLVKHGLAQYPAEAEATVLDFAALRAGRLAQILELIPARRRVVRVVRQTPPEADLSSALAQLLELPGPLPNETVAPRNKSLGSDTEIVLRINRAGLAVGTDRDGRQLLEQFVARMPQRRADETLAARYAIPASVREAAQAERAWLRAPDDGVEVVDPHGALAGWCDLEPPEWYREISRAEAVIPELADPEPIEAQLWRARQERAALARRLERVSGDGRPGSQTPGAAGGGDTR